MKYFLISLFSVLFLSCVKTNTDKKNTVLLLKVDYVTNTFEGGIELDMNSTLSEVDSLPISIDIIPAADFGNVTLFYEPEHEMIFDGSIIWSGTGQIKIPEKFDKAASFKTKTKSIDLPDSSKIQLIYSNFEDYLPIWEAVNNLEIVETYLKSHKNIVLFRYTPSVGSGDPNEWDWFIIMNS